MSSPESPDSIGALRNDILSCNVCFDGSTTARGCWHHEDILGGYSPGKILVLTINAQRPFDASWEDERYRPSPSRLNAAPRRAIRPSKGLAIYQQIRDASPERKQRFADASLGIFAGASPGEFADWIANHKGHKSWLPTACEVLLGASGPSERLRLATSFVFLDIYKHATANETHLNRIATEHPLILRCPERWLNAQIVQLQPAIVLLCGKNVISKANLLWGVGGEELSRLQQVGLVHGRRWPLRLANTTIDCWTSFAIADQAAQFFWKNSKYEVGTNALRCAIERTSQRT